MHLTVAVATYRRPDELVRCLEATCPQVRHEVSAGALSGADVLVVDNDREPSAESAVRALADPLVRYVHEPRPGISAARNRALTESAATDLVVFLDDDETPRPGWLAALLAARERYRADAVVGRVVSDLGGQPDAWITASRFFERPRRTTGTAMPVAATNNLLLDRRVVERLGLRFADRYGLTGGGDTHFTRRFTAAGASLVWCDEAVVVDHVPPERVTRSWVLSRARRMGNSQMVVALDLAGSTPARARAAVRALAHGGARVAVGTAMRGLGTLTGSAHRAARGEIVVQRGVGMAAAVLGRRVSEYARPAQTTAGEDAGSPQGPLRVLCSFPDPRPTTNPYITMLLRALRATSGLEVGTFRWSAALLRRWDVFHAHWPETLVTGGSPLRRTVRQGLFWLLLLSFRVRGTVVVQTVHNVQPHEQHGAPVRAGLAVLRRSTTARIALNPHTAALIGRSCVLIPHGDYVSWFADHPRQDPQRGAIAFAGLVRAYKNVTGLVTAFRATERPGMSLRVLGRPDSEALEREIVQAADGDPRISLELRFVDDAELVAAVTGAQVLALPYEDFHNSGTALLALSLDRPVLVPDNEISRDLAAEVGEGWVRRFDAELGPEDLLAAVEQPLPEGRPDLSRRSWARVGEAHRDVYRTAVRARRERRS
ncbi:glycosyltransferase [Desertihabitans aurantiacus]|uniref:glycosyltransferase n=1 Tax=Desertihabitans aurantiacus TaxID=2282477 RepID=UPI0018E57599|nr:glycosyltransferase [Desertihabitans aurantiacus]